MEHFPEHVWADLVRGVSTQHAKTGPSQDRDLRREVESHLESGCETCAASLGVWKQVYSLAARESSYSPPEDVVRMTKLEFTARSQQAAEACDAALVFDTFSQPALAGVRSSAAAARQMVYEADGFTVDVRFDRTSPKTVHLFGQVLDADRSRSVLAICPVLLCSQNGALLAEGKTNYLGEFDLQFEAQDGLKLSIWVSGSKLIRIALSNLQPKADA